MFVHAAFHVTAVPKYQYSLMFFIASKPFLTHDAPPPPRPHEIYVQVGDDVGWVASHSLQEIDPNAHGRQQYVPPPDINPRTWGSKKKVKAVLALFLLFVVGPVAAVSLLSLSLLLLLFYVFAAAAALDGVSWRCPVACFCVYAALNNSMQRILKDCERSKRPAYLYSLPSA